MFTRSIRNPFTTKKYILSQFPYPSGDLHLGHARVYYIGDALSTYYRLQHFNVFYPIGWDSFGLPAENAAILHGQNPQKWTQNNIKKMKHQLLKLGVNFNWEAELSTSSPSYYKWTQSIFTKLFKKGLAYRALGEVNWDPVDKTVLANQQVDETGRSWRSGALVQKKMLQQWFLRITSYGEVLSKGIEGLNWVQRVKAMQKGWIGHSKGHYVKMKVQVENKYEKYNIQEHINIFCQDLNQLVNSNSFIKFSIDEQNHSSPLNVGFAINPITNQPITIKVFPEKNYIQAQLISDSSSPRSLTESELKTLDCQPGEVMRLKDWLVSRQRYWGTPIPIVYCDKCGVVPVPDEQLPVLLPHWKGSGNPLLEDEFRKCKCPKCSGAGLRETDTMDTFVDSSWYYLRFLDDKNAQKICSSKISNSLMPVDIYIGGIEHAIMHLLYARFVMHFLSDQGVCKIKQPFSELVVQGLVKGKTLKHTKTGRYLKKQEEKNYPQQEISVTFEKMSKSKFNGLNPNELLETYGTDALRLGLFFANPPDHDIDFSEQVLTTCKKFLLKVQQIGNSFKNCRVKNKEFKITEEAEELCFSVKNVLEKLEGAMEKRFLHVYVANLMEILNTIKTYIQSEVSLEHVSIQMYHIFLILLEVVAPSTSQLLMGKVQTLSEQNSIELWKGGWPSAQILGASTEYLIMQGSKLMRKGKISSGISNERILQRLGVSGTIKRNKKNIVIVV